MYVPLVGVRGFHQCIKRRHIIYLSDELNECDARFVCAHELAHAILHKGFNRIFLDSKTLFITSKYEIEADRWAAELLLPPEELEECLLFQYTIPQIAVIYGLAVPLVEYLISQFQQKGGLAYRDL